MSPSKLNLTLPDAIDYATKYKTLRTSSNSRNSCVLLLGALRASEARAELLERQYDEIVQVANNGHAEYDEWDEAVDRHAREREALE